MIHFRITGSCWVVLGMILSCIPLTDLIHFPWSYLLHNGFDDCLGCEELLMGGVLGTTCCAGVVTVGWGMFLGRGWAQIGCVVLASVLPILAVRDYSRHMAGQFEFAILCAVMLVSIYSLVCIGICILCKKGA